MPIIGIDRRMLTQEGTLSEISIFDHLRTNSAMSHRYLYAEGDVPQTLDVPKI